MPVIVVGADTDSGLAILTGLFDGRREVRAFVTNESVGLDLKETGFKVAIGDVTDESHVEAAATTCFSAILVAEAALDDRERSFAPTPDQVLSGWARAVEDAGVTRIIWVADEPTPATPSAETAVVSPNDPELVARVVALDDAQTIGTRP